MAEDERSPRSRQDPRRDGGGAFDARFPDTVPPSTRAGVPQSTRPGAPGPREEQALYRRLAELQAALVEAEACVLRGRGREAAADEMNGQMLARVSEVEGRLRGTEDALRDCQSRAQRAEARAVDLEAQLAREKEARETLRLRVVDLAEVCDERDGALIREELLEVELEEARNDLREQREAHEAELTLLRERGVVSEAHPKAPAPAAEAGELESAGLRADRDALAAEARQLRTVVDAIARALGELKLVPRETTTGEPTSASEPAPAPAGETAAEDDTTRVFGAQERALVRSLGRR